MPARKMEKRNAKLNNLDPLVVMTGDKTEERNVDWLFYPYIARSEVTLLSADPGSGKTFLATWIAARVTRGLDFPVYPEKNQKGTGIVWYLSKEDGYEKVIVPRFNACDGNGELFHYPSPTQMPDSFTSERIDQILEEEPDLIIFDAVSSFIGDANMNMANEVRRALYPLLEKIRERKTAILLIAHNNKMNSVSSAQYRVSGSVDFTAFVRSGLIIGKKIWDDKAEPQYITYIMAQYKNNLDEIGESLEFKLKETGGKMPKLEYEATINISADELTGGISKKKDICITKVEDCRNMLEEILNENGGWAPVKKVYEDLMRNGGFAYEEGFTKSTINRARKMLGTKCHKLRNKKTGKNVSFMTLPDFDSFEDIPKEFLLEVYKPGR